MAERQAFSQPSHSSAAERVGLQHTAAPRIHHSSYTVEPEREELQPSPGEELPSANPPQRLLYLSRYTEPREQQRERPRGARNARRSLQELSAMRMGGEIGASHLAPGGGEQHVEPSASRFYQAMQASSLDRDEDYNHIRGFGRSMSPTSPYYSPWSSYLPNYSPTSPNYSPASGLYNPIGYAPADPGHGPSATAQHLIDDAWVREYAPSGAARYNPTPNTRYAPTTSTMRPPTRSPRDDRAPHSRSTMDYFRLLSRASDTQHWRMRQDRDRFHASAVARSTGPEEARATAHRSRSREGVFACPSRPCAGISPCSFIRPGMTFEGVQSSHDEVPTPAKEWSVNVEVTQVSLGTGALSGTITARNIPHQPGSVTTYFTGEVIDMSNYNFMSPEHDTDECMDWNHWNQFSAFCAMSRGRLSALGDLTLQEVDSSGCIFMRWKERAFVSKLHTRGQHGSLTITGFYYVCLARDTGKILGSYCDPAKALQGESTHFSQQLRLKPGNQKNSGYSFGTVSFS